MFFGGVPLWHCSVAVLGAQLRPVRLGLWDWRLKAAAVDLAHDVLEGVGDPAAMHVEGSGHQFALQVRRKTTIEEAELFKARKDAGDYACRLVAKGIV